MERRALSVAKYLKLGHGWITDEGRIKKNS